MRLRHLHTLIRRISRRGTRAARPRQALGFKPFVELLEDLTLLTATWTGALSNDWNVAGNWMGATGTGGLPGPNDDVQILVATNTPVQHASGDAQIKSLTSAEPISLTGGDIRTTAGVTLNGSAALTITGGATLGFEGGTQTLGGNGSVVFGDTGSNHISLDNNVALTVANGFTIGGNTGAIGAEQFVTPTGTLTNSGTINDSVAGGTFTINPTSFTNNGTVKVSTATSTVDVTTTLTNFNSGTSTLTGGTYNVVGTFKFPGADIVKNAAAIILDGTASQILDHASSTNGLSNFTTNAAAGSFTLKDGQTFGTPGSFSNAGNLTIDATGGGSRLTAETYTQTGGNTVLVAGGTLLSVKAASFSAGALQGTGTVTGSVTNSGATVSPGVNTAPLAAGILSISGGYTQQTGGTLALKVGGTTTPGTNYDQLLIGGTASLAGTIGVTLFNNYAPAANDVIPNVLHFTSVTGDFNPPLNLSLGNGLVMQEQFSPSTNPTQLNLVVSQVAGAATHFTVSAPSNATAGSPFSITVTALDQNNSTATGYTGTVHFTKTDGGAGSAVPADYTFVAGDNGVHTFTNGATFVTAGSQTVTATDTVASSITGSATVAVRAAAATHFTVSAPASATAGTAFSFTVTALDAFNNTATGYTGTVHFTSSDGQAVLPANGTLTNGTGTFSATLKTAGSQTLTATDTVTSSLTGTSNTIAVSAAAATHFAVSAPASATAGTAFSFTVTAQDQFNNTATGYGGTVHFTSSDGAAVLPANSTLTNGTGTFSATLKTGGSQTLTATDTATSSIAGTSNTISVSATTATHFTVSAPASATAGSAFSITVTALDAGNNTVTGYTGTVHFTSTDGAAVLPADSTLTNGTGTFTVTLKTAGNQTLTATDTATSSITGTSGTIAVSAAAATHFAVSAPASATAGAAFSFTVTALDRFNNTATGYGGTVHFTSSDGAATLPANSTLTNGVGTFSATLKTAGNQTLTATDTVTSSITGTSNAITVSAAAATHFTVNAPSSATAGAAFSFTVTALDQFNNTAAGYTGTVHFTSTDGQAVLPANTTLTNGTGSFSATLKTAGSRTVTATDTVTSSITGTSGTIAVSAAAATHFAVSAPASATAGAAFSLTVTAQDQFNNTATGYGGTVHFTSSDGAATLPANSTLTNGTGTFSATLKTAGNQTLTATDTATSSITGTSNTITVSAAAATHFTVSVPASATAGVAFSFTVTALDQFNNTAAGYTGTAHFTSSDGAAGLPANSTLTNGTGSFSATLNTPGSQTITATDTVTSSITGTSNTIAVGAAGVFTYDWNGSVSTDWFTAANWTDTANSGHHAVPTAADSVVITGGPNATVLNANATVANLQISTGFLTLNASLTDAGSYYQDQGFVAFGSNLDWLIIGGNVSRFGGFLSTNGQGTVVLDGTSVQTITDMSSPEHPMANLNISNPAGVVLTTGSNLAVQGSGLSPGSALTLAGTATLNVIGLFVDDGTVNLSALTPNNATAPLTVGHRLTAGNTAVFNLTVGSPASGNVYRFVQFLNLTDNGATFNVTGNGLFSTQVSETAPFIAVTTFAAIYDWNGSVSTDWFTAANWTDVNNPNHHAVPTAVDAAIITGGPNATVLNANATVANLQISTGTLTLNASLTDAGSYYQDQGFVAFGSNLDWLIIGGNVSRFGGFLSTNGQGTVVLDGTSVQTITDMSSPEHPMANLNISNPAGVVLTTGSNLAVQGSGLSPGSALTLAGTATLNVIGLFVDDGTVNLSALTPNNATAPLTVGHRLTAGNTAVFNLTVGSPASGNVYRFVQFLNLTDNGATFNVTGNGAFSPVLSETAPFIAVTTVLARYNWNGSVSSDWFNPANWTDADNPNRHFVPGPTDTAVITGGPNGTVLSANATVGNLVMANGFLTLNANLTDSGTFFQDQGFVAFGSGANQLLIAGNILRSGGQFFGTLGTVVWNGTAAQTVSDTSGHPLPNLSITNPAGVTLTSGSNLAVTGNVALSGMLTLAGTATLNVGGSFTNGGTLNLSVPAPGNAAAPLVIGGSLTMNAGSVFNLTMGAPFSGATYLFIQYGSFMDNGAQFFFFGQGAFTPTKHENANSLTVTLA